MVLPCFPLGGVYVPEAKSQVLNIFEPRYRLMYNDILFSGGRRFVVPQARQEEDGRISLSEVGVVFYLDDLQEVSEQTGDRVKFVCSHSIIGRVRIKRVLNPGVFETAATYLRVGVEEMPDTDAEEDCSELEERASSLLSSVAGMSVLSGAEARIGSELDSVNTTRTGFWTAVSQWDDYLMASLAERQRKFESDVKDKIQDFVAGMKGAMPQTGMGFDDMPEELRRDLVQLQEQYREEVQPAMLRKSDRMQEMIQSDSHSERLTLFADVVDEEKRRLDAKSALKSLFDR